MSELEERNAFWRRIILIVSVILTGAIAFLILGPRPAGLGGSLDVSGLPLVNATLNGTAGVLLLVGLFLVRAKRIQGHKRAMLSAFACSAAFLVTYVIYHWFKSGPQHYEGDATTLYFTILISHILLATIILPMALFTLYLGWTGQIESHRPLARITLPLWLYVSATGVIIYGMLYQGIW
jgi:putative membrane protein